MTKPSSIALAGLCSFGCLSAQAQLFERQTASAIETIVGDSRSVNWADIDGDGDQDLLITNGPELGESNFLFRNDAGTFVQVTTGPVANDGAPSDGATFGDIDNDDDVDLFVANWWEWNDMLYMNDGNGAFTEITSSPVALDTNGTETGSWGDYDNDGYLDLYAAMSAVPLNNKLYHNNGNGTFTAIATGVQSTDAHVSRCVNWTDTDLDGDLDLFVTNESNQAENLYVNDGAGGFTALAGSPLVSAGSHTMSSSWGDHDNDGDLDVFLANANNNNKLFRNEGGNVFTEVLGQPMSSDANCSFSSNWVDVDNDADLDLFVTNAYCPPPLFNYLYLNDGAGNFVRQLTDVVATDTVASYGQAFADTDGDGDLDLVVANVEYGGNNYYLNNGNSNHHVRIRCVGTLSNTSAIGTKVYLTANIGGVSVTQMREITAQGGYCSQNEFTAHFGLAEADSLELIKILWPSGLEEVYINQPVDVQLTAIEGDGIYTGISDGPAIDDPSWITVFSTGGRNVVEGRLNVPGGGAVALTFHDITGKELGKLDVRKTGATTRWQWNIPNGRLARGNYVVRAVQGERSTSAQFNIE
ncbi:MAG: CRTAC1 family protein [Flavobacteriales bacterium]